MHCLIVITVQKQEQSKWLSDRSQLESDNASLSQQVAVLSADLEELLQTHTVDSQTIDMLKQQLIQMAQASSSSASSSSAEESSSEEEEDSDPDQEEEDQTDLSVQVQQRLNDSANQPTQIHPEVSLMFYYNNPQIYSLKCACVLHCCLTYS